MKKRIYISAAIAAAALIASFFGLSKCEDDHVVYVDREKVVEVALPPDTVYLPARTVTRVATVYASDSANEALRDSVARLVATIRAQQQQLYELAYMTATVDTTLRQKAVVSIGGARIESEYTEDLTLAYDYYPIDEFKVVRRKDPVIFIDSTAVPTQVVTEGGAPWWIDALIALAGVVAGFLAGQ